MTQRTHTRTVGVFAAARSTRRWGWTPGVADECLLVRTLNQPYGCDRHRRGDTRRRPGTGCGHPHERYEGLLCNQLGVTAPCREGTVASPTSFGFERGTIGAADESDDPVLRALDRATQLEGRVSVDGQTKEFQRALVSTIRCRLHQIGRAHV